MSSTQTNQVEDVKVEMGLSQDNLANGLPELKQVNTTITLTPEQFEKIYLSPMGRAQHGLTKTFGNPTPLALASFVLTTTPVACALMGWRGAGGGGIALNGAMVFLGGTMLVISGLLEFVLGNTFSFVVFCSFGGFWLAFGCTLQPALGSAAPYSQSGTDFLEGLSSPGFMNTFGFMLLAMDMLVIVYAACSTRTNVVFFAIFLSLICVFSLLTAGYWRLARADAVAGNRLLIGGGASLFVTSLLGWYLLTVQLFDAVGIPLVLPVGDLSSLWRRRKQV